MTLTDFQGKGREILPIADNTELFRRLSEVLIALRAIDPVEGNLNGRLLRAVDNKDSNSVSIGDAHHLTRNVLGEGGKSTQCGKRHQKKES